MSRKWVRFAPRQLPKAPAPDYSEIRRGSPKSRGYDHEWTKLSIWYRQRNPFCEACAQEGVEGVLADVVDHMIPVRNDRSLRLDPRNIWSLCNHHHEGMKARLERHARLTGQTALLQEWCRHPEKRPI